MTTRPTLLAKSLFTMMILVNSSYANTTPPQDKTPNQLETQRQDQDELKAQMEAKIRAEQRALQRAKAHHHGLVTPPRTNTAIKTHRVTLSSSPFMMRLKNLMALT